LIAKLWAIDCLPVKGGLLGAMALQRNTSLAGAAPWETAGFGGPPRHNDGRDGFGQGLGTGAWDRALGQGLE
jgi:hypothetical protein